MGFVYSVTKKIVLTAFLFCLTASGLLAAYLEYVPQGLTQPDGSKLYCFASGDEYYNWLHDREGYTIIQNQETGWYVYAGKNGNSLIPTIYTPGKVNPAITGIPKWLKGDPDKISSTREKYESIRRMQPPRMKQHEKTQSLTIGTLNNIVIFIRFADEQDFGGLSSTYQSMFNQQDGNSLYNYFHEASYGKLSINSTMYPQATGSTVVSYQDAYPRAYYQPYNAITNPIGCSTDEENTVREHTLLKNAIDFVRSQIPAGLDVDSDDDGYVDNVCFIVSGYPGAWASLLWPHMWALYTQDVDINGKRVWSYNFLLQYGRMSVGVMCHEMFHTLGAPDLYHYNHNGISPAGCWDIMEWDTEPPQHMTAYMKHRYGNWIDNIPVIEFPGYYTLNPLSSESNNAYKIRSPYSDSEYFIIEYRKKDGTFENSLPGSGLIAYRINTAQDGMGNAGGPPDELYVYRPGGSTSSNGNIWGANMCIESGRTSINDGSDLSGFLMNGDPGHLSVYEIGEAGESISFYISLIPPAPQLLSPANGDAGVAIKPAFTWTEIDTNLTYRFQISESDDFSTLVYEADRLESMTLDFPDDLEYLKTYYWRVKAYTLYDSSEWSETFMFDVTPEPPVIKSCKSSEILCLGKDLNLFVVGLGSVIQYQWLKDGIKIENATNAIYIIDDMDYSKSAVYKCMLTNFPGIDTLYTNDILIYAAGPAKFVKQPVSRYELLGRTSIFSIDVHISGLPEDKNDLYISWFRGNQELRETDRITGVHSSILSIRDIQPSDFSEDYYCKIIGYCGDTIVSDMFSISLPFLFDSQSNDSLLCKGNAIILYADTRELMPGHSIEYTWYKDGTPILNGGRIRGANERVIWIEPSELSDEGIYALAATIMPERIILVSEPINVRISDIPLITMQPPATQQIREGSDLIIEVSAESAFPCSYQWFKNGRFISDQTSPICTQVGVSPGDEGAYVCRIYNECGETWSDTCFVTITNYFMLDAKGSPIPDKPILLQSEPNPCNGIAKIDFFLPMDCTISIKLSGMLGNETYTLAEGSYNSGYNEITINPIDLNLSPGVYYYTMTAMGITQTMKLVYVR